MKKLPIEEIEMFRKKHILYIVISIMLILAGCGKQEVLNPDDAENEKQAVQSEDSAFVEKQESEPEPDVNAKADFSVATFSPYEEEINYAVYSEGRYCYRTGNYYSNLLDEDCCYGYLSEKGIKITPCIYSSAEPFPRGLPASVWKENMVISERTGRQCYPLSMIRRPPSGRAWLMFPAGMNTD